MFGSVTRQNICHPLAPRLTAARSSSVAERLHHRDELARDERERHERRREDQPRRREDDVQAAAVRPEAQRVLNDRESGEYGQAQRKGRSDAGGAPWNAASHQHEGEDEGDQRARRRHDVEHGTQAVGPQPRTEVALKTEDQHEHQPRYYRRDRERHVDQRGEERPAGKTEPGDQPGGGDAEHDVQDHGDRRHREGQGDRAPRIPVANEVVRGTQTARAAGPARTRTRSAR